MSHELEVTRALNKATQQNERGRYYRTNNYGAKEYGYRAWQTGEWVCYTCGLICNCLALKTEVYCGDCLVPINECTHGKGKK